jgi:pyrimidine operon attenuation protein/uracil phosphoribosyltransferase
VLRLAGKRQGFFVMRVKAQIMDEAAVKRALVRISHEIVEKNDGVGDIILAGIKRRGVPLSQLIADNIKKIEDKEIPLGILDISLYRDDLTRLNENPEVRNTEFPFDITGKKVILVDDVIYTGRTARAAIEALFECGRPDMIQFAVLIDRGHRELPIRADFVGKNVPTSRSEMIEVRVPEYDGETGVYLMELAG